MDDVARCRVLAVRTGRLLQDAVAAPRGSALQRFLYDQADAAVTEWADAQARLAAMVRVRDRRPPATRRWWHRLGAVQFGEGAMP